MVSAADSDANDASKSGGEIVQRGEEWQLWPPRGEPSRGMPPAHVHLMDTIELAALLAAALAHAQLEDAPWHDAAATPPSVPQQLGAGETGAASSEREPDPLSPAARAIDAALRAAAILAIETEEAAARSPAARSPAALSPAPAPHTPQHASMEAATAGTDVEVGASVGAVGETGEADPVQPRGAQGALGADQRGRELDADALIGSLASLASDGGGARQGDGVDATGEGGTRWQGVLVYVGSRADDSSSARLMRSFNEGISSVGGIASAWWGAASDWLDAELQTPPNPAVMSGPLADGGTYGGIAMNASPAGHDASTLQPSDGGSVGGDAAQLMQPLGAEDWAQVRGVGMRVISGTSDGVQVVRRFFSMSSASPFGAATASVAGTFTSFVSGTFAAPPPPTRRTKRKKTRTKKGAKKKGAKKKGGAARASGSVGRGSSSSSKESAREAVVALRLQLRAEQLLAFAMAREHSLLYMLRSASAAAAADAVHQHLPTGLGGAAGIGEAFGGASHHDGRRGGHEPNFAYFSSIHRLTLLPESPPQRQPAWSQPPAANPPRYHPPSDAVAAVAAAAAAAAAASAAPPDHVDSLHRTFTAQAAAAALAAAAAEAEDGAAADDGVRALVPYSLVQRVGGQQPAAADYTSFLIAELQRLLDEGVIFSQVAVPRGSKAVRRQPSASPRRKRKRKAPKAGASSKRASASTPSRENSGASSGGGVGSWDALTGSVTSGVQSWLGGLFPPDPDSQDFSSSDRSDALRKGAGRGTQARAGGGSAAAPTARGARPVASRSKAARNSATSTTPKKSGAKAVAKTRLSQPKPKPKASAKKKARASSQTKTPPSRRPDEDSAVDGATELDLEVRSGEATPTHAGAVLSESGGLEAAVVDKAGGAADDAINLPGLLSDCTEATDDPISPCAPAVEELPLAEERSPAAFTVPPELLTAEPIADVEAESPAPDDSLETAHHATRAPHILPKKRKRRAVAAAASTAAGGGVEGRRKGKSHRQKAVPTLRVATTEAKQKPATSGRKTKGKAKSKLSKSKVAG